MTEYRSVVTVIIDDGQQDNEICPEVMQRISATGLGVTSVDGEQGVIEGVIASCNLHTLEHLKGVRYVRRSMEYLCKKED